MRRLWVDKGVFPAQTPEASRLFLINLMLDNEEILLFGEALLLQAW